MGENNTWLIWGRSLPLCSLGPSPPPPRTGSGPLWPEWSGGISKDLWVGVGCASVAGIGQVEPEAFLASWRLRDLPTPVRWEASFYKHRSSPVPGHTAGMARVLPECPAVRWDRLTHPGIVKMGTVRGASDFISLKWNVTQCVGRKEVTVAERGKQGSKMREESSENPPASQRRPVTARWWALDDAGGLG